MPLKDPVAVYNAANNVEANLLCNALRSSGIEAYAVEDVSQVGTWVGGLVPEIHKPQIWVERDDLDKAVPILTEYEQRAADRSEGPTEGATIGVVCDGCGGKTEFPAAQGGSVQSCPHCGAFLDVGEGEAWWGESEEEKPEGE